MRMSCHIKQQMVQGIFHEGLIFLENGITGFFCFLGMGEAVSLLKIYCLFYVGARWLTVLNYCTLCRTEQTQLGNRGSNPMAVNQFLGFSFLFGLHVLTLFLNWKCYLFHVAYFT